MAMQCSCFDFALVQHVAPFNLQLPLSQIFLAAWAGITGLCSVHLFLDIFAWYFSDRVNLKNTDLNVSPIFFSCLCLTLFR